MAKIAMFVWNAFTNDARVLKEAETLSAAGHHVTIYAYRNRPDLAATETMAPGIVVNRVKIDGLFGAKPVARGNGVLARRSIISFGLKALSRLWAHLVVVKRIYVQKADVIHAHDVNTLPTSWLASALLRKPLVYDAHEISTDREGYLGIRKVIGRIEKTIIPRTAGMITTTDMRAKFFALAYKVARPVVLQNRPRFSAQERNTIIQEHLKLKEDWPVVLYQGGLQQGRGLPLLVEAATQVENAYFVFIGGGRMEQVLKSQVEEFGLQSRVHFIETLSLDKLPIYTAAADIGVQALENTCLNHYSTDSNKLFEYAMAGLATIATNMPEIRKIIDQHKFGILVEPGNVSALADAINRLVQDADLRQTCAANARQARQELSWETQEHKLAQLYERVLAGE